MRLNSIKLSGFKSFAEATHFALPGQMVGVVGPNGCGKSNIMDAVRWVLGESRASELRGQAMQDVIFSGTLHRKPASRASVELLFDNHDRRASGPWGQFAEISVRRTVTRDGSSGYFLNNQAVRRRDVQDLFLGTGLGPRAYAIIGQGTISRIVEARPEDLRLFLEEAAGVSRYKERRRETENRLDGTAANLARVQDILREMQARLEQLQQQAELAEHHERLQQQHTEKQHQLWYLRLMQAQEALERVRSEGLEAVQLLEGRRAELELHQASAEELRQAQDDARHALEQAQETLGQALSEVVRLETEIHHVLENREQASGRVQHIGQQLGHWQQGRAQAQHELEQLQQQGEQAREDEALARARLEEQLERLPQLEEALERAQQAHERQRNLVGQVQQELQGVAAEQRAVQAQRQQQLQRQARLRDQARAIAGPDVAHLARVQALRDEAQEASEVLAAQLAQWQDEEPLLQEARQHQQQVVNEEGVQHAQLAARHQALEALQEKLQAEDRLQPWLQKHGLDGLEALWRRIAVEPGWENALEAALRERLGALQVGRLDMLCGLAERDAPPARLTFFAPPPAASPAAPPSAHSTTTPLLHWLRPVQDAALHALLTDWLQGCHTASDLRSALALRDGLGTLDAIYLPQGHAVRRHSISFHAPDADGQSGMLARAQEIERLQKHLRAQDLVLQEARAALVRAENACQDAALRLASTRRQASQAQSRAHELQVQALQLEQQAEQARLGRAQIDGGIEEAQAQLEELDMQFAALDERFAQLDLLLAGHQQDSERSAAHVQTARQQAQMAQEQLRALERQAQEADFACRSILERRGALERTLETAQQQTAALEREHQAAQAELERLHHAAAPDGLEQARQYKMQCEQAAAARRSACEALDAQLRALDAQRQQLEQSLEPLRQRIQEAQLNEQKAQWNMEQNSQFLQESGADLAALAQTAQAAAAQNPHSLQGDMERLQAQIAALGPVNLAAVQELRQARERETFLNAQAQDLEAAMETLQGAIRKMDQETRQLMQATFESVNQHLAQMFTLLFGGGQAHLTISGEDILDCGVQIMAQPPGKKNQTIHLLSGGEKALCAIALVFAMFQLNPAPFCLLDEVDAPLDDANTGRYASLVANMSKNTQFLFISHNRIAMERADQLIGVTMQEQGVSRIVAVDVRAALESLDMAAA